MMDCDNNQTPFVVDGEGKPVSGSLVNAEATLDSKSKEALPDPSGEFVMISHCAVRERDINLEGCGWVALNLLI
jgi:hypothetical protein